MRETKGRMTPEGDTETYLRGMGQGAGHRHFTLRWGSVHLRHHRQREGKVTMQEERAQAAPGVYEGRVGPACALSFVL